MLQKILAFYYFPMIAVMFFVLSVYAFRMREAIELTEQFVTALGLRKA